MKTHRVTRARNRALPRRGFCRDLRHHLGPRSAPHPSGPSSSREGQESSSSPEPGSESQREGPLHHCLPCTGPGQGVQGSLGVLCGGVRGRLLDWEPWWSLLLLPLKLEPQGRTTPSLVTIPLLRPAPQGPPWGHPHHGLGGSPSSSRLALAGKKSAQRTQADAALPPRQLPAPIPEPRPGGAAPAHHPHSLRRLGTLPTSRQGRSGTTTPPSQAGAVPGLQLESRRCPGSWSPQQPGRPTPASTTQHCVHAHTLPRRLCPNS